MVAGKGKMKLGSEYRGSSAVNFAREGEWARANVQNINICLIYVVSTWTFLTIKFFKLIFKIYNGIKRGDGASLSYVDLFYRIQLLITPK